RQGATVDQGMIVSLFPVNAIWVNSYPISAYLSSCPPQRVLPREMKNHPQEPICVSDGQHGPRENSLKRPPKVTMGTIPNLKKSKKQAKR
ncbi:hypothetical protein ACV1DV_20150, partial [Aeromonas veronii]